MMERHEILDLMSELKLTGMRAAFDDILATGVKRQHPVQQIVADFERTVLEDALRQCRGDIPTLQAMLQTPRKTIYDKLAKYDLKPSQFR